MCIRDRDHAEQHCQKKLIAQCSVLQLQQAAHGFDFSQDCGGQQQEADLEEQRNQQAVVGQVGTVDHVRLLLSQLSH